MKKARIVIACLLVAGALLALVHNIYTQREVLYIASLVAVVGTILVLVKEVAQRKQKSSRG